MLGVNPSRAGSPFSTMWRRSPTWFFRQPHPPPRRCCNRRALSPSFRNRRRSGRQRLVASLPRAGGNTTGFTNIEGSIAGKWLEWLKQIAPRVNRVALLFNPATAPYAEIYLGPFGAAAEPLVSTYATSFCLVAGARCASICRNLLSLGRSVSSHRSRRDIFGLGLSSMTL